ncbi:MAG: hypothetical protein SFV20_01605, partial [Sphingopyxis sp.]|nr:hypothetical protein [Sphingopyxis sp.]
LRSVPTSNGLWLKASRSIVGIRKLFGDNNSPNPTKARRIYAPSLPLDYSGSLQKSEFIGENIFCAQIPPTQDPSKTYTADIVEEFLPTS